MLLVLVFPQGEAFVLRRLPVSPVFHLGEGVGASVRGPPAVLGPEGLGLRGLAGGGPLQPHRDPLGRAGHQGDGLRVQSWTCRGDCWELKHLIVVWRRESTRLQI